MFDFFKHLGKKEDKKKREEVNPLDPDPWTVEALAPDTSSDESGHTDSDTPDSNVLDDSFDGSDDFDID